jgi:hypothetical protein
LAITFVRGDIFLSRAQVVGIGWNARGKHEASPLASEFASRYPAALSSLNRHMRSGRLNTGDWWIWREARPWLAFLIIRQTHVSATRARYVEDVAQKIARDWNRESMTSLALPNLGEPLEWPVLRSILKFWLEISDLPVVVYEEHAPGLRAPEPWDTDGSKPTAPE